MCKFLKRLFGRREPGVPVGSRSRVFDAVTHSTATRNGLANNVTAQLNSGTLELQTAGSAEVATLGFNATAFGSATGGTSTANAITPDTNATGGVVTKAALKTSGATSIVFCSVTAAGGGGDIELNSATISAGQEVSLTSLTYSASP